MADLLGNEGFQTGALYAAGGVVVVALVALLVGGGPRRNPWAGLVFAGAAMAGLADQDLLPGDLRSGIAVLAVGGLLSELLVRRAGDATWAFIVQPLALIPGAALVADSAEIGGPGWVTRALFVTIVSGGTFAADLDRWTSAEGGWAAGLSPLLWAVTVGGMWATVPETEHAVVLAGAAVPVAFLAWPRPFASLGVTGSALAVALLAWTTAVDGIAREGAIVGGFTCLGMFVLGPVLVRRFGVLPDWPTLLVGHVVVVGLCSRVAGLSDGAGAALLFSALAYLVVGVGTLAWSRRQRI